MEGGGGGREWGRFPGDGRERDPLLPQCFPSVPACVIPTGAHPDAPKTRVLETRKEMDAAQTHLMGGGGSEAAQRLLSAAGRRDAIIVSPLPASLKKNKIN